VNQKELEIPLFFPHSDVTSLAQTLHITPMDIICSPLNATMFRFSLKEIADIITSFIAVEYPQEWNDLQEQVAELRFSVEQVFLPSFQTKGILGIYSYNIKHQQNRRKGETAAHSPTKTFLRQNHEEDHKFWIQLDKWTKKGGFLLECMLNHLLYSVDCFRSNSGYERTTITLEELCECNAYWCNTFNRGLLRSRANDITNRYDQETEILLELDAIEDSRLQLVQYVFADMKAVDLVVKQLSVAGTVSKYIRPKLQQSHGENMEDSLQIMALALGTAINEGGNKRIQVSKSKVRLLLFQSNILDFIIIIIIANAD
jgi:hypothetical protein